MSNQILSFNFKNSNIRSELINGEPWFVAKDLCEALGYQNARDAIRKHVFDDDVAKRDAMDSLGRQKEMSWVN